MGRWTLSKASIRIALNLLMAPIAILLVTVVVGLLALIVVVGESAISYWKGEFRSKWIWTILKDNGRDF